MDVEALAVSKITNMIGRCPHLKAFITTNDKTPFTDGYIDLYSGLHQSKKEWSGRVTVQVKGRSGRSKGPTSTYAIAKRDLLAYQKDSGVLYFVVSFDRKTSKLTPYYALLSPYAIEWMLQGAAKDRGSVSVPLKKLANDPNKIESLVALALKTRDQNVALGFDAVLFERLKSLTVHTASSLKLDAPVTLAPGATDFALVANTHDGLSMPLRGEFRITPHDYIQHQVDIDVRSGSVGYQSAGVRRIDTETVELELSKGLRITLRNSPHGQSSNISLTLENTLHDRLKAIGFFVALIDTRSIEINGTPSPFVITKDDEDSQLRQHLAALRDLQELFDLLAVDTRLVDLTEITDAQAEQLNLLYRAVVRNEEIADPNWEVSRVLQKVGSWNLMLLIAPGGTPGQWRVVDPFSSETRQQLRWSSDEEGEEEPIPITAFDIVEEEHLTTVINLGLDSIVGAYQALADFPSTFGLANQRVLALISAADACDERQAEFLDGAERLSEWLISEEGGANHLINRWQIAARRNALSADQRKQVRELNEKSYATAPTTASRLRWRARFCSETWGALTTYVHD